MPKVPFENRSAMSESIENLMPSIIHGATPMMIVGVQRKINTGNFENVDIYAGLTIPIMNWPEEDLEKFKQAVADAAELGFSLISKETADRYALIKNMQRNTR